MSKKYFDAYPPFINRIVETEYVNAYLGNAPTSILFLYWPKSTGKTTMIEKVIKELDQEVYAVDYLDMRQVLITNFQDFKSLFFPEDLKGKIRWIVSGIKMNVGFFGWDIDDEKMLKTNIFAVMVTKLEEANKKGIRPVIILDEFQYLRDIILDKENNLLLVEELFKFFIALTKVRHLAHIICLTSDSYYIEELYQHAKLKNTSRYYLIDHMSQKDIEYWLGEKEWLEREIVEYFWEHLGGSVWEIWQCLMDYKNTGEYKPWVERLINDEYVKSLEFWKYKLTESEKNIFRRVSHDIAVYGEYIIPFEENIMDLIKKLVDRDIWFYNSLKQSITANSQTVRKAFEKMFLER